MNDGKNNTNTMKWLIDVIKYSLVWVISLGFVTVIIGPIWMRIVESGIVFSALSILFLGIVTKYYFVKAEDMRRNPNNYD